MPHRPDPQSLTLPNNPKPMRISAPLRAETVMILDPQRRNLFAQRLALLIRRIRASTPIIPQKEVPDEH
jgi:hypothetical protein